MQWWRREEGQSMVMVVVGIAALVGIVALVLDVGSWFRAQRKLQTAADAAALAGVQELPNTASAGTQATSFADLNYSGASKTITYPSTSPCYTNGCIRVSLSQPAPGFFSRLYGLASVTVHAHARAMIGVPTIMKNVAPVAITISQVCTPAVPSCFGTSKTLNFNESNLTSSAFGLVSLSCSGPSAGSCSSSGTGSSDLNNWIRNGFSGGLPANAWYAAVTGEKIGPVRSALEDMGDAQKPLLIPVFDTASNSPAAFHIVGWAAFVINPRPNGVPSWKNDVPGCRPACKVLTGHFVTYIAHGIPPGPGGGPDFGVRAIALNE
jgi:hypothetical protein